ncbi:MAG: hypothetical protein ACKOSQ_05410 [Planctomycetaceae bacterium]
MSPVFRSILRALTPRFVHRIRVDRARRAEAERLALAVRLHGAVGGRVLTGPFAGMRYGTDSTCGTLGPKLLGTYERELAPVVERIVAAGRGRIIDVGAAEGWYAVGLLTRLPAARGVAFESTAGGRALLRDMALANGVADRLDIRGHCGVAELAATVEAFRPDLVVCDAEGAEREILDPIAIPRLAGIDMLVEIHDFIDPATGAALERRFRHTHTIERIATRPRRAADVPAVGGFSPSERLTLADELRPCRMEWFWLQARG